MNPHTFSSLSVVLALVLVACSSDDDAKSTSGTNDAGANVSDGAADGANVGTDGGADAGPDGEAPGSTLPSGLRDRAGRAYVETMLLGAANRASYNGSAVDRVLPTDTNDSDGGTLYGSDFQTMLSILDGLDGTNDWNGGGPDAGPNDAGAFAHPLANDWITVDALLVDPNMPFSETSYLDLEANPGAQTTCGGRWPGDDALDKTLSFLVKKSLSGVSDGVDAPAKAPSQTFPYLAEPF